MTDAPDPITEQEDLQRTRALMKMTKRELCALYRRLGHVWSLHPIETWRKDEIVADVRSIQRRQEAQAAGCTSQCDRLTNTHRPAARVPCTCRDASNTVEDPAASGQDTSAPPRGWSKAARRRAGRGGSDFLDDLMEDLTGAPSPDRAAGTCYSCGLPDTPDHIC